MDQELYCPINGDTDTWGYQDRYSEWRYYPSRITGSLRSNDAATLHARHLSEELGGATALNAAFVTSNTPMDRVVADGGTAHHFTLDVYNKYICATPLPVYGTPLRLSGL